MATILCVDDTRADLALMVLALEEAGHEVLKAEHVPGALELLESEKPDLIVSDYRLPKVSGLEFLGLLQRRGLSIPLIMSTAYATVEDAVSSLKAGAVDEAHPHGATPVRRRPGARTDQFASGKRRLEGRNFSDQGEAPNPGGQRRAA